MELNNFYECKDCGKKTQIDSSLSLSDDLCETCKNSVFQKIEDKKEYNRVSIIEPGYKYQKKIALLVDVSESMKDSFVSKLDSDYDMAELKIDTIFDIIESITEESYEVDNDNNIFCIAFGMQIGRKVCDLVSLLKLIKDIYPKSKTKDELKEILRVHGLENLIGEDNRNFLEQGYKPLMQLFEKNNINLSQENVEKIVTFDEAQKVFIGLAENNDLLKEVKDEIPEMFKKSQSICFNDIKRILRQYSYDVILNGFIPIDYTNNNERYISMLKILDTLGVKILNNIKDDDYAHSELIKTLVEEASSKPKNIVDGELPNEVCLILNFLLVQNDTLDLVFKYNAKIFIYGYNLLSKLIINNGLSFITPLVLKFVLNPEFAGKSFLDLAINNELKNEIIDELKYEFSKPEILHKKLENLSNVVGKVLLKKIEKIKKLLQRIFDEISAKEVIFHKELKEKIRYIQTNTYPFTYVNDLFKGVQNASFFNNLNYSGTYKINNLVNNLSPYIFGNTPMFEALCETEKNFEDYKLYKEKFIFIITDGAASNNFEEIRRIASHLKSLGIMIIGCYINSVSPDSVKKIPTGDGRTLYCKKVDSWERGDPEWFMYDLSSSVSHNSPYISILREFDWNIPESDEVKLFADVSHPKAIHEFSKILNKINDIDVMKDIIGKIEIEKYVNQFDTIVWSEENNFQQVDNTCYAHAIAVSVHLTNYRLTPNNKIDFVKLKDEISLKCGGKAYNINKFLKENSLTYGLFYRDVISRTDKAVKLFLKTKRPLLVQFSLNITQWGKFKKFFSYPETKNNKITKEDLASDYDSEMKSHAVVLTGVYLDHLTFMNFWGKEFGNCGFIKVMKNALPKCIFFDLVFIRELYKDIKNNIGIEELTEAEMKRYKEYVENLTREQVEEIEKKIEQTQLENNNFKKDKTNNLARTIPKRFQNLFYKCMSCAGESKISEFGGDIFEAVCPKCNHKFKPNAVDLLEYLYGKIKK